MTKKNTILHFILLILLVWPVFFVPQNHSSQTQARSNQGIRILVIYRNNLEKNVFQTGEDLLQDSSNTFTYQAITEFNSSTLQESDMLIFTSVLRFNFTDEASNQIDTFLKSGNKTAIFMSPHLNRFNSQLQQSIGIKSFDRVYPFINQSTYWDIEVNRNFGSFKENDTGRYRGRIGVYEPTMKAKRLASVSGSNSTNPNIDLLNFPIPIIVNATNELAQIITSGISFSIPERNSNNLQLNQFNIITNLILELVETTINYHQINFGTSNIRLSDEEITPPNDDNQIDANNFLDFPLNYLYILLLIGIVSLIALFNKVLDFAKWIIEKTYGLAIGITGVFYNIQERELSHSDISLNQTRAKIIEYLEYIGPYGAHLREIKSMIHSGMGSLLWHLQILEEYGWIQKYKVGRYTVYITSENSNDFDEELKLIELKMVSKHSQEFLRKLSQINNKQVTMSELSNLTSIDKKTLRRFCKLLMNYEVLDIYKDSQTYIEIIDKEIIIELLNSLQMRDEFKFEDSNINISFT